MHEFCYFEAPRCLVHADGHKNDHGLVGDHLEHLALSAEMAVGRADSESPQHEEGACQGQAEDDQQKIGTRKEKGAGKYGKQEEQNDAEVLEFVDDNSLFLKKFQNVKKGLSQRRTVSALQSCTQFSIHTGQEPSNKRREHEKGQHPLPHAQRLVNLIDAVHMNATPNITQSSVTEIRTPALNRRSSPKYFSR